MQRLGTEGTGLLPAHTGHRQVPAMGYGRGSSDPNSHSPGSAKVEDRETTSGRALPHAVGSPGERLGHSEHHFQAEWLTQGFASILCGPMLERS